METWTPEQTMAMQRIKRYRDRLTWQQEHTLRGQVKAGEPKAAIRGLNTILRGGRDGSQA